MIHQGSARIAGIDFAEHLYNLCDRMSRSIGQIIYVPDEEGDGIFVVTAYEIRGKPLRAYRKRRRRRR